MNVEKILSRLVRVGVVTAVNNDKYIARVMFKDTKIQSDWMIVLDNRPFIPDYDVPQRTEFEAGGAGDAAFASHKHPLKIKQWMPKVGQPVLVLYVPVEKAEKMDGYILGGMQ